MADKPKGKVKPRILTLTIMDRVMLPAFLLKQGSMAALETAEDIKKKVVFSKEESDQAGITKGKMGITWKSGIPPKLFTFSKAEARCLKESYRVADEAGTLHADMLGLCRKIIEMKI